MLYLQLAITKILMLHVHEFFCFIELPFYSFIKKEL